MKDFSIAHNIKNGNYYIYHKNDVDKWGIERQHVIYQSSLGYYYKKGKRVIYLTEEETEALGSFRRKVME
jgi:hypothetical protein